MVKQYTANVYNWLKTKLNSTASNSKMNGTQSAGFSDLIARADHVHPVDTSRAPNNHATSATIYGVGSASNYGHVKVDSSPTDSSSNAVASGGVKTVLDTKQNAVETQAKVTQFTNKDRITLERLIERMNNPDSKALFLRPADSDLPYYTFCENIKVAKTYNRGIELFLDGAVIGTSASSVVLKKIDGTKIGDFIKRGSDPAGWGYPFACSLLGVGIHYLYAEATFPDGSVRKSNIVTAFVKDTNNKLDYNLYSAGDYNNNTTGLNRNNESIIIVSSEWSSIGENSFRISRTSSTQPNTAYFTITNTGSSTITTKMDIYCPTNALEIQLYDGSNVLSQVTVPAGPSVNNIVLSSQSDAATLYVRFRFANQKDYAFLDNISAITS